MYYCTTTFHVHVFHSTCFCLATCNPAEACSTCTCRTSVPVQSLQCPRLGQLLSATDLCATNYIAILVVNLLRRSNMSQSKNTDHCRLPPLVAAELPAPAVLVAWCCSSAFSIACNNTYSKFLLNVQRCSDGYYIDVFLGTAGVPAQQCALPRQYNI